MSNGVKHKRSNTPETAPTAVQKTQGALAAKAAGDTLFFISTQLK